MDTTVSNHITTPDVSFFLPLDQSGKLGKEVVLVPDRIFQACQKNGSGQLPISFCI